MKGDREYLVDKLFKMAMQFNTLYEHREYTRAAKVYRDAEVIARHMELTQKQISELFGYWPDDGDPDTEAPDGLFSREKIRMVDWKCCIRQHKTYQDEACRRLGEPQRFYSDEDYCSLHCQNAHQYHEKRMAELRE